MRLEPATREQIAAIYRESYALWGTGLTLSDYGSLWDEVSSTRWAREHATFCVWLDDRGRVLSSLKLYRPLIRIGRRECRATVLGAIFTPREFRRQGHAGRLVRAALDAGRARGDGLALLFSDIGTEYYEAFGFRALPAQEQWGALPRTALPLADGWILRPLVEGDMPAVHSAHRDTSATRPIAVLRDEDHWDFLRVRSDGYFRRLSDPAVRQVNLVAIRHGRFAGFLTAVEGRGEWNVREVGAAGGDAVTMAAIIGLAGGLARKTGQRRYYGWLPPDVVPWMTGWKIRAAARIRAVPMLLAFEEDLDVSGLATPVGGFIPYQDQF